jgi:hypothetical protein
MSLGSLTAAVPEASDSVDSLEPYLQWVVYSGFPSDIFYTFRTSPICATCRIYIILPNSIILVGIW